MSTIIFEARSHTHSPLVSLVKLLRYHHHRHHQLHLMPTERVLVLAGHSWLSLRAKSNLKLTHRMQESFIYKHIIC